MAQSHALPEVSATAETADGAPAAPAGRPHHRPARPAVAWPIVIARILGIAVPLGLFVWTVSQSVLSFDGAMNTQVAANVADGQGYQRFYGDVFIFPEEIQTSSYFVFLNAAAIYLFGPVNLAFQFANIVCMALLLTAVSYTLPRSIPALVLVPGFVVVATPGLVDYSMGGYGEGPVAALVLVAFIVLAKAAVVERYRWPLAMAMLSIGVAVSIKTVAVAALPVIAVGLVLVVRRHRAVIRPLVISVTAAVVPLALFEVYRAISLGDRYTEWWRDQLSSIRDQAVGSETAEGGSLLSKIADHFHLLSNHTSTAAEVWLVAFAVIGVVGAWSLWRWPGEKSQHAARTRLVVGYLLSYGLIYVVWWMAATPTEKAWLRRITIGLFALVLAGTLLLVAHFRAILAARPSVPRLARDPSVYAGVALLAVLVLIALPTVKQSIERDRSRTELSAAEELSAEVLRLSEDGAEFFGVGWWSAPVISLYSTVGMENLQSTDICGADRQTFTDDADSFLVWDRYAEGIVGKVPPEWPDVAFEETGISTRAGTLWRIVPASESCLLR